MSIKTYRSQRRMAEIQHMRGCGSTPQQIGDQYGMSRKRVCQTASNIHKKKCTCGMKSTYYPNSKKWTLDNRYSALTKLVNDMDMCLPFVRSLLIKGESPTKCSTGKITEFIGVSADEVLYLSDVAAQKAVISTKPWRPSGCLCIRCNAKLDRELNTLWRSKDNAISESNDFPVIQVNHRAQQASYHYDGQL